MSIEIVFGALGLGLGVGLTLIYQARNAAVKAVKEASEAVASVNDFAEVMRVQYTQHKNECEAKLGKFEARLDDLNSRVASLQMKR